MAHCPTCQQGPGMWGILAAAYFRGKGERFACQHCERAVAVPGWQRRSAWLWLLAGPLVAGAGLWLAGLPWWAGILALPAGPLVWARWLARVVRPVDATMAKPPRRHSRKRRHKQDLL